MIWQKFTAGGNDFLITHDMTAQKPGDFQDLARKICNRHFGIGADGAIFLRAHDNVAYAWDFLNSDGSAAKMCGNASLCVAFYAVKNGLAPQNHEFFTGEKNIIVKVQNLTKTTARVMADLNLPCPKISIVQKSPQILKTDTGVPHIGIFVAKKSDLPVQKTPEISRLREIFDANVNFIFRDEKTLFVNTFERGVENFTLSCGTGMTAAAVFAREIFGGDDFSAVPISGENYEISFKNSRIFLSGTARAIAEISAF